MTNATDTLFDAWKKEDRDERLIKAQKHFICMLCGVCLLLGIGWYTAPSRLTVYIPPDISNGATLKAGEIPNPLIYSFAYQIWQEINYWQQDGTQDYPANIHAYGAYLTPAFKAELLQEFDDLKAAGQVQRQRTLQGITGAAFEPTNIKKIGENTWEVDLHMRLTEYKNSQPVKDIDIVFPLKIVRMHVSQESNPYGLVIAGYVSEPVRLKTYI